MATPLRPYFRELTAHYEIHVAKDSAEVDINLDEASAVVSNRCVPYQSII